MKLVFARGAWALLELETYEDAVEYGRPQWCTTREVRHFDSYKAGGTLFVLWNSHKARPQYQLWVRTELYCNQHALFAYELRDGGNLRLSESDLEELYREVPELLDLQASYRDAYTEKHGSSSTWDWVPAQDGAIAHVRQADLLDLNLGIEFVHHLDGLPADARQGQVALLDDTLHIFHNGFWVPFAATGAQV